MPVYKDKKTETGIVNFITKTGQELRDKSGSVVFIRNERLKHLKETSW